MGVITVPAEGGAEQKLKSAKILDIIHDIAWLGDSSGLVMCIYQLYSCK